MAENPSNSGIKETSSFPGDIPPIASAVPAFVGYTEKALKEGKSVLQIPVSIASLIDYENIFGGAPKPLQGLKKGRMNLSQAAAGGAQFFLYYSLQLYFANGGTTCSIVSIGDYSATPAAGDFLKGIDALLSEEGSTLLVAPDAVLLSASDCGQVQRYMLAHCAQVQRRFAILDVPDGFPAPTNSPANVIDVFRNNLTDNDTLKWGAAYYPWLNTPFLSAPLPPSGAVAGVYCAVDQQQGVFKAPANVALAQVNAVTVSISDHDQQGLNSPIDGKSVNAIRAFAGKGTLVWGARTLDGNNSDNRYVSVRRTVIYLEQSIKAMLDSYRFGQNTPATWTAVKAIIENFLTTFWRSGGLQGAKASDAFTVQIGLGITMTQQDITDGYLRVTVLVALVRPAEFVVLTFEQEMARS